MPSKNDDHSAEAFSDREPEVQQLEPGTVLRHCYQIIRRLDSGKLSAVYLATDERLGELQRTIEEFPALDPDPAQDEQGIADFSREMRLRSKLRHPSIPTVCDYFYDERLRRFYVVTECISGYDLASRMKETGGRIDEKSVTKWAIQIADALEYLHMQPKPVVYQNLKPQKIVIDDEINRVALINSGIAHWLKQEGKGAVGTVGYAPVELFNNQVEPRSDVYSLGATMFYVLTGVDPQDDPLLVFDFTKNPKPRQITPSISIEMERIIMRAVEHLPKDRPTAGEMRDALIEHLEKLTNYDRDHQPGASIRVQVSCPFCGGEIAYREEFCPFCGNRQKRDMPTH